ncbi:MAG TPA: methyltransferase domain-containing protein [Methanobacteriaceae archaeon]|nr:methyltransferase domain-containing protein [Methanobacteriaceae archaeon]
MIMGSEENWKNFRGKKIPSSVDLDDLFFEKIVPGCRVLDFGCGWGKVVLQLHEKGYQVEGFDINFQAVKQAQKELNKLSLSSNEVFIQADARNIPYSNNSFDVCILQAFLTTIIPPSDRTQIIDEVFRVLKPNGYLYLADFARDSRYLKRYHESYALTGEMGTFLVKDDKGNTLYPAHHYTTEEIELLLNSLFTFEIFKKTVFTSYHGNRVNGFVVLAQKKDETSKKDGTTNEVKK